MIAGATGEAVGQVGDGSRKDIRDAVEAAHSAAKGWGNAPPTTEAKFFTMCVHAMTQASFKPCLGPETTCVQVAENLSAR